MNSTTHYETYGMFKKWALFSIVSASTLVFSQQNSKQKFGSYIDSLYAHHKIMGSFAIMENGNFTFQKAVGYADADQNVKATIDTPYRVGSITKTFTGVLIMKAVEENKISLTQKLSEFYSEIPNAEKITLEHLLQHRSGIHNLTDEAEFWQYYTLPHTEAELINQIKKYKSDFEPGSRHYYSNSNYILLGLILQKIYNKPYADLIKSKIVKPLKLNVTEAGGNKSPVSNHTKSYNYLEGKYTAVPETDMSIPVGAGNIISNPLELIQFITALENGKLIRKESLGKMKSFTDDYGYGLVKFSHGKTSGYGHTGGIDNFRSALFYFPNQKIAVSYTLNQWDEEADSLLEKMITVASGEDFVMPDFKEFKVSEKILSTYTGTYHTENFPLDIKVFIEEGTLKAQATGQSAFSLKALSETEFKFDMYGIKMKFNAEKKTMDFSQGANNFTFKKQ